MVIRQFKPVADTKQFFTGADQDVLTPGDTNLIAEL